MILNEIQPRDTNDYFNQAKLLKEYDSFNLEDLTINATEVKGNNNMHFNQNLSNKSNVHKLVL